MVDITTKPQVFFVLGGPGAGKGTQCLKMVEKHNFVHLSAGDLLREERDSGSDTAALINQCIVEGKIVPVQITCQLLKKGMEKHGWNKKRFLIDGFPRNQDNFDGWDQVLGTSVDVPFCVFLDADEDTMIQRIQERSKTSGRNDDNIESLRKRFATFKNESMPIIEFYDKQGKMRKIDGLKPVDEVFAQFEGIFKDFF